MDKHAIVSSQSCAALYPPTTILIISFTHFISVFMIHIHHSDLVHPVPVPGSKSYMFMVRVSHVRDTCIMQGKNPLKALLSYVCIDVPVLVPV